jgi:hypothetical protein
MSKEEVCSLLFGEVHPAEIIKASVAPFGGLIALFPAPLPAAVSPIPELDCITISSPSGSHSVRLPLRQVSGGNKGSLVAVGWTDPELLVCCTSKGHCEVITPTGVLLSLAWYHLWSCWRVQCPPRSVRRSILLPLHRSRCRNYHTTLAAQIEVGCSQVTEKIQINIVKWYYGL